MRFLKFFKVLDLARRAYGAYAKEIIALAILGLLGGLLEGIGINAVIPLLSFVVQGSAPATDAVSMGIRFLFGLLHVDFAPKFLLGFVVLLFFGKAVVSFVLTYIQMRITTDYATRTRRAIFQASVSASWRYLIGQKSGYLETVSMVDVPASTNLLLLLSTMLMMFMTLLMYLAVAFNISPAVTAVTMFLGVAALLVFRPIMRWVKSLSFTRANLNREITHDIGEYMGGMKVVKAFGAEDHAVERVGGLFEKVRGLSLRIQIFQTASALVVPPIGILYIALIFALSFRTHFIAIAALPAIVYLIYRISLYVQQIQSSLQAVSEYAPHLSAVLAFEEAAKENAEEKSGQETFSFKQALVFDHVSFSYDAKESTLKDISFSIVKGSMTGIIGPSGSGKTTCVDLLLRLLAPSEGTITLDGVSVSDIDLRTWHEKVSYVSQDVFLMRGTIRENISFYQDLSDAEVMEAARLAHIDTFIAESRGGLDTMIGDRGITLSAGQRQRLSIARALARKPEILVLDEATSSLDSESEMHIQEVIKELKGRITIIVIAHRLSTIMDSDQLVVLDKGRVVERGEPEALLKDKDSYFFKVYSIR